MIIVYYVVNTHIKIDKMSNYCNCKDVSSIYKGKKENAEPDNRSGNCGISSQGDGCTVLAPDFLEENKFLTMRFILVLVSWVHFSCSEKVKKQQRNKIL